MALTLKEEKIAKPKEETKRTTKVGKIYYIEH